MTSGGLQSSAYGLDATTPTGTIAVNGKILENDIVVTESMLNSNSGMFRVWWSFTTGADYEITITKKGEADLVGFPLIVNADNLFVLKSNGYYRFDVGVKPGDFINLSSSVAISKVNDLQIQQIQIGAWTWKNYLRNLLRNLKKYSRGKNNG